MPSPRITLWLFALVLLGTGYLFFFEMNLETTQQQQQRKDRVFHFRSDQVEHLKLRRDAWTSASLERADATSFRIVEPTPGMANSPTLLRFLSSLEFLSPQATLDGDGEDARRLYEYGLNPPQLEFVVGLLDKGDLNFTLGKDASIGKGVYLHVQGDRAVYVVKKELAEIANQLLDSIVGAQSEPERSTEP
jgi:hypothetical protein